MKLRRVFLGAAVVALMAACGGKTETTTETATPAEETQVEEVATAPVEEAEAPVAKNDAKPAERQRQMQSQTKQHLLQKLQKKILAKQRLRSSSHSLTTWKQLKRTKRMERKL